MGVTILSTLNRPPKELLGMSAGVGVVPSGSRAAPETITLLGQSGTVAVLAEHPAAATDVGIPRTVYDATRLRYVRLVVEVEAAGASSAILTLEHRAVGSSGTWSGAGALAPVTVSLSGTGLVVGASVAASSDTVGDREYRVVASGGDDIESPALRNLYVQFLDAPLPASTPPVVPPVPPSPCNLDDGDIVWSEHWDSYGSLGNWEATEGQGVNYQVYSYIEVPDGAVYDTVNTYNGHPVITSPAQDTGLPVSWYNEYYDGSNEYLDPNPCNWGVRMVAAFHEDWTTNGAYLRVLESYSTHGGNHPGSTGWSAFLEFEAGDVQVRLSHIDHDSDQEDPIDVTAKVANIGDWATGSRMYFEFCASLTESSITLNITWGAADKTGLQTTTLHVPGLNTPRTPDGDGLFSATENIGFGGSNAPSYPTEVAEWDWLIGTCGAGQDDCSITDGGVSYFFHDDFSSYANSAAFESLYSSGAPKVLVWYGDESSYDDSESFAAHPILTGTYVTGPPAIPSLYSQFADDEFNDLDPTRASCRAIMRLSDEFTVPSGATLNLLRMYSSSEWQARLELRDDGTVWLVTVATAGTDDVQVSGLTGLTDGDWRDLELIVDVDGGTLTAYVLYGAACSGSRASLSLVGESVTEPITAAEFLRQSWNIASTPLSQSASIAEWGTRHGTLITLPGT